MKINIVPPSILEGVIAEIKSAVPVHSVYWINGAHRQASSFYLFESEAVGDHSECYQLTLLLITYDKVPDRRKLSQRISEKTKGEVKTHLILYTYEDIYDLLEVGDNFLSRALKSQHCLFQESSLSVPKYMAFPAMYNKIENGWRVRTDRALYFEANADILDVTRNEVARMAIISQIIYHSSTSLLWAFWEWPASTTDIDLLLNLCKTFTDIPDIVLPDDTFKSQQIYQFLCDANYNLHYNFDLNMPGIDTEGALEKATEFRHRAMELGKARIDLLKKKHFSKSEISTDLTCSRSDGNHLITEPRSIRYN